MFRPALSALLAASALGCVDAPEGEAPAPRWAYVPPDETSAPVDPGLFSDVVARAVPLFAAVDPTPLDALADEIGAALEGCAAFPFEDARTLTYWFEATCADGSVTGFAYQIEDEFTPGEYPGYTGHSQYVGWTADARSGDLRLWGAASWGTQDVLYDDGTVDRYTWLEGDVLTDDEHRPAWLVDGTTPNVAARQTVFPDGTIRVAVEGNARLEDPRVDAISLSFSADADCTGGEGWASIHLRDGDWVDLALTESAGDCTACGEVVDALGNPIGTTCIDVAPLVALGADA
jgi:hypothetical protein